jgi:hypothetical protein
MLYINVYNFYGSTVNNEEAHTFDINRYLKLLKGCHNNCSKNLKKIQGKKSYPHNRPCRPIGL